MADTTETEQTGTDATRRDFLYVATGATGAVIAASAVWPLIDQMNPSADVRALSSIKVDISGIEEGQQITVLFQGKPVFFRNRHPEEIAMAKKVDVSSLRDTTAQNANLKPDAPATDANRTIGNQEKYIVMWGICTHLGCVPLGNESGNYKGWFCPCHGSQYDTAGRIRQGPAPENLHIPVAKFLDDKTVQLG